MLTLQVGRGRQVTTITHALAQVPPEQPLKLLLDEGEYHEKIFCMRPFLHIAGAGADKTKIVWQDGAFDRHADGRPNGTFRSYTAFFDGDLLMVEDLTIENAAKDGKLHGQAIAAAVHTRCAWFRNVQFLSAQDTLFIGPLPEKERLPDGFLGPRQHTPRISTQQLFEACHVAGDVDFIFGGGDALFCECHLHGVGERQGFLSAPSTVQGGIGFIFDRCRITSETPRRLALARPWRPGARAVFLNCDFGEAVSPRRFDNWQCAPDTFEFLEYPVPKEAHALSRVLKKQEAEQWRQLADNLALAIKEKFRQWQSL